MANVLHTSADGKHNVTIARHELRGNGQIAVCLRCCDDPTTEHWHLIYNAKEVGGQIIHELDGQTIMSKLSTQVAPGLAQQHDSMQAAHKFITSLESGAGNEPHKPTMTLMD